MPDWNVFVCLGALGQRVALSLEGGLWAIPTTGCHVGWDFESCGVNWPLEELEMESSHVVTTPGRALLKLWTTGIRWLSPVGITAYWHTGKEGLGALHLVPSWILPYASLPWAYSNHYPSLVITTTLGKTTFTEVYETFYEIIKPESTWGNLLN